MFKKKKEKELEVVQMKPKRRINIAAILIISVIVSAAMGIPMWIIYLAPLVGFILVLVSNGIVRRFSRENALF